MDLSTEEMRRYSRHLMLPEIGRAGQNKICEARILCVGAGGLGSPAVLYLAAAGIGTLGIVDDDVVDESNLQRQVLHRTKDRGRPKVDSAREQLSSLNPHVRVETYAERLSSKNARQIIRGYDLVIDGSDNFPTRYLVNDACVFEGKPCVYGAVFRFEGQASLLGPAAKAPCYRCLYPQPPAPGAAPSCAEAGVLGVLPGIMGLIQATEALKRVLGAGESLAGRLLLFDALRMIFREVRVKRDPACPVCGEHPTVTDLIDYEQYCGLKSKDTPMHPDETSVQEMQRALKQPELDINVLDVREADEHQIAHVEGVPLLPLSELPKRFQELDPNQTYYIHCKAGGRSMRAVEFLKSQGFKKVKSVAGGITAWSEQIDPSVPKY
jgi:adenylyltransferase/sulfurtransferase